MFGQCSDEKRNIQMLVNVLLRCHDVLVVSCETDGEFYYGMLLRDTLGFAPNGVDPDLFTAWKNGVVSFDRWADLTPNEVSSLVLRDSYVQNETVASTAGISSDVAYGVRRPQNRVMRLRPTRMLCTKCKSRLEDKKEAPGTAKEGSCEKPLRTKLGVKKPKLQNRLMPILSPQRPNNDEECVSKVDRLPEQNGNIVRKLLGNIGSTELPIKDTLTSDGMPSLTQEVVLCESDHLPGSSSLSPIRLRFKPILPKPSNGAVDSAVTMALKQPVIPVLRISFGDDAHKMTTVVRDSEIVTSNDGAVQPKKTIGRNRKRQRSAKVDDTVIVVAKRSKRHNTFCSPATPPSSRPSSRVDYSEGKKHRTIDSLQSKPTSSFFADTSEIVMDVDVTPSDSSSGSESGSPSKIDGTEQFPSNPYGVHVGDEVWGKMNGCAWWPGRVYATYAHNHLASPEQDCCVTWFGSGDHAYSYLSFATLEPFEDRFSKRYNHRPKRMMTAYQKAVAQAILATTHKGLDVAVDTWVPGSFVHGEALIAYRKMVSNECWKYVIGERDMTPVQFSFSGASPPPPSTLAHQVVERSAKRIRKNKQTNVNMCMSKNAVKTSKRRCGSNMNTMAARIVRSPAVTAGTVRDDGMAYEADSPELGMNNMFRPIALPLPNTSNACGDLVTMDAQRALNIQVSDRHGTPTPEPSPDHVLGTNSNCMTSALAHTSVEEDEAETTPTSTLKSIGTSVHKGKSSLLQVQVRSDFASTQDRCIPQLPETTRTFDATEDTETSRASTSFDVSSISAQNSQDGVTSAEKAAQEKIGLQNVLNLQELCALSV